MHSTETSPQPDAEWDDNDYSPDGGARPGVPPPRYLPPPVPPAPPEGGTGTPTLPVTSAASLPQAYVDAVRSTRAWLRVPSEKPLLTLAILALLVIIYIPMFLSSDLNERFLDWGAKINENIIDGEWWRLITMTLLHASPLHILLNGYALYVIGMDLESFFGRARFGAIYLISALAGSVASFAFSPLPGVGASGAIFGLIGALGVYYGLNRQLFGRMGQAQFWNIIIVIVLNLGIGFSGFFPIDNSAHLGGLVAGALAGYVLCPRYTLGQWSSLEIREVKNTNGGLLMWATTAIIALDVIFLFFVVLLRYQNGLM